MELRLIGDAFTASARVGLSVPVVFVVRSLSLSFRRGADVSPASDVAGRGAVIESPVLVTMVSASLSVVVQMVSAVRVEDNKARLSSSISSRLLDAPLMVWRVPNTAEMVSFVGVRKVS